MGTRFQALIQGLAGCLLALGIATPTLHAQADCTEPASSAELSQAFIDLSASATDPAAMSAAWRSLTVQARASGIPFTALWVPFCAALTINSSDVPAAVAAAQARWPQLGSAGRPTAPADLRPEQTALFNYVAQVNRSRAAIYRQVLSLLDLLRPLAADFTTLQDRSWVATAMPLLEDMVNEGRALGTPAMLPPDAAAYYDATTRAANLTTNTALDLAAAIGAASAGTRVGDTMSGASVLRMLDRLNALPGALAASEREERAIIQRYHR